MIEKNIIELFSCRTAAAYYSFSEAYFRKLLRLGLIESKKIGYSIRMNKKDIDAHFAEKQEKINSSEQ